MNNKLKSIIGTAISIVYALIYVGGGSYLFARYSMNHVGDNSVSIFFPVLLMAWIIGFMVGHFLIEYLINKLIILFSYFRQFIEILFDSDRAADRLNRK